MNIREKFHSSIEEQERMKSINILLIEDNEGDILLTKEAFEDAKILNQLSIARDGQQAIHFLEKKEPFVNVETPDLILLDVNLPKKNGHEVLQYIKGKIGRASCRERV